MRLRRGSAALLLVAACAQPQAPPGGEPDRTPPAILSIEPEPLSVRDSAFAGPVRIVFSERISERLGGGVRDIKDAVLVSPQPRPVEISQRRSSLEIRMKDGWPAGYVYRVFVMGVLSDLFGNQRTEPIELVFSTGAPIQNTVLAGVVTDRITGDVVDGARIRATRRADDMLYLAASDTGGFFAMRHIPAGAYDLVAFQDRNRDGKIDFGEPVDTVLAAVAVEDTTIAEVALLPGDTTPARLVRAEPLDTTAVRLAFDDYFDPDAPIQGRARLFAMPDSTPAGGGRLMRPPAYQAMRAAQDSARAAREAAERAAADSAAAAAAAAADTTAADTAAPVRAGAPAVAARVPPDTVLPAPPAFAAPGDTAARDTAAADTAAIPEEDLPVREIIFLPDSVLVPERGYVVEAEGVVNIRGVTGGGGAVRFQVPAPPRDTTTAPDSLAAPDTLPPADSTLPPVDTVPPPADTLAPAADTVPPPADTVPPPADSLPPPADTVPPPDTVPAVRRRRP